VTSTPATKNQHTGRLFNGSLMPALKPPYRIRTTHNSTLALATPVMSQTQPRVSTASNIPDKDQDTPTVPPHTFLLFSHRCRLCRLHQPIHHLRTPQCQQWQSNRAQSDDPSQEYCKSRTHTHIPCLTCSDDLSPDF